MWVYRDGEKGKFDFKQLYLGHLFDKASVRLAAVIALFSENYLV